MRGTLMSQRYVDDILRPHVGPFPNGLSGTIFQQDNARLHTARVAQDFLCHFQTLPWLARSPDLSPVEHVWNQLKRQMPSGHSVHDLELAVQDLWAHLPQDNIRCLINSMPDHVAACITAGGVVQRTIEVAQYLCRCTPCIRLIVLLLRSSESLICAIMFIKFHFNPMLSSWAAIFNVPECIINRCMNYNILEAEKKLSERKAEEALRAQRASERLKKALKPATKKEKGKIKKK
ncbi:hypothetical protein TNCV_5043861 [Trichonephila clavipes]|uniref:Tc1-like transposase DDE domain-containing protein n=1 Tax=Trichonephila clavipes TaxID=2585209 RepID=A0A8X7BKX2_TRICX|nr:hypothetical protein TNCV_5043861 [Trichonephila clavipes]